jgi:hypothetical protein
LRVLNGYEVLSCPVIAFMKVLKERGIIEKNGSRTGYFCEPASTTCSKMCATPVESCGTVGKVTFQALFSSAQAM